MQKTVDHFLSADGKSQIAAYFYQPEQGSLRGIVQISHGMCEYLERYEEFIGILCEKGLAVCGNDHLGHGHSAEDSGSLGFFSEEEDDTLLAKDLHQMTLLAKERYPELPLILFGHSMGSFAARRYLALFGRELDGAVICGTAGKNPAVNAGILAAKAVIRTKGSHYRSRMLDKLAFGSYNKRFLPADSPHVWLTRDQKVVEKYDADPFCNYIFTAAGFRDLLNLLKSVSGKQWAEKVPRNLPVLLVAGQDDPVGNFGKGVLEVERLLRSAGVSDLTIHLYPGCRHEILNEIGREVPISDICGWIDKILAEKIH